MPPPTKPPTIEETTQTSPLKSASGKSVSGKSRPVSSKDFLPSKDLQDILLKLGTLNDRHEQLKNMVEDLRVGFLFCFFFGFQSLELSFFIFYLF